VVGQCFLEPPAKWAGVVEHWFEDAGIFGEDILPIADPVIGPAFIVEQTIDGGGATIGTAVTIELFDLVRSWDGADGVERDAAEETPVVDRARGFDFCLFKMR